MINVYNQVPSIYPSASRDFQYLCWLINIVLNDVKHNIDDLYDLPNTKANPKLTELLAMTLGFRVKRNYDQKQLAALVSILPRIFKCKGTKKAVKLAGEALINASGTVGSFDCAVKDNTLEVVLPKELVDTTLFIDLLPYILPAGMGCHIVRKTQRSASALSEYTYQDTLEAKWCLDLDWDESKQDSVGLTGLLATSNIDPESGALQNTTNLAQPRESASLVYSAVCLITS